MQEEKQSQPQLRFPNFDEGWDSIKLEEVCTFFSGGTPTSSNKNYYKGDIPFIGSENRY
ncbi:restriction endonuclease subunit S [Salegentibacter sp. HM20]